MHQQINKKFTVSPYLLSFIIYSSVIDAGMMYFQRDLVQDAGYDAWLSILIAAAAVHLIIWMMYKILSSSNQADTTIVSINRRYFGKIVGTCFNLAIALYFSFGAFCTFRTYLEVVQVWIFPYMQMMPLTLVALVLIYYTVSGGFRTVTGLSFWATCSIFLFIAPLTLMVIPYLHPQNMLPALNHSTAQILKSTETMFPHFLGFEVLLVMYPFIEQQAKSQKWAQLSIVIAIGMYMLVALVAFMYYSEGQIIHTIWPTLNMISIVEFPLMQRVEYIIISIWFVKMLANISLGLWSATHSLKLSIRANPRLSLIIILVLFIAGQLIVKDHERLQLTNSFYGLTGIYFTAVFIPLMLIVTRFKRKRSQ
ncbi:GerAB/ArcD/ProY family transporter [Paenibacillus sp. CGMCC 1.16610]|uniref:GerAB/ArcD/ProY family transporter n=1 Tax=Paenibacillus anseongense TaxID=2682845 RepID=A0ABW9U212_9BACL|nr:MULTISPECIES: GerAB/ArcD/ProY family transporter [Paenibacillus]MBA2940931.1 GerAB/ArcD/ProY family transporter [Paenibacillus sp. CGMCC 1.16610]MVQ34114.1 GerAB/ArcD/ProY family transporter [Paenibacillus anseongense]